MRICEYIVHYLSAKGVSYAFGVDGANIEDVFDAIVSMDTPLKVVLAKHEFCAACMADGYSRSRNGLGVVLATSGGGSLNVVAALGESLASHQPVLAILGMPPTALEGRGAFQDSSGLNHSLDGKKLFSALASKYFHRCRSAKNFANYLDLAVKSALTPPFGTSILMIPKDIQLETIKDDLPRSEEIRQLPSLKLDPAVLSACAKAESKVLIVIGEAVRAMGATKEVLSLCERLNAWVAVTPEGKSAYKTTSSRFVGLTGVAGHLSVFKAAKEASTLILIGTRFQLMARAGLEEALNCKTIIYINNLPLSYQFSTTEGQRYFLIGDIKNLVQQLLDALPQTAKKRELPVKGGFSYQHPHYLEKTRAKAFNFESIFLVFDQYIKDDEVIYADAGNTGGAALHYLKEANYFGIALGMGGMGYAIGAAIGSCFENREVTWCFVGDGALLMHGMEIHTAIEHQLPLRFIVLNNNAHAMCYDRDLLYQHGKSQFNLFKKSYYGKGFAAMFPGFYAHDISSLSELKNQLNYLQNYHKPALLSLNVDYHEVPPFLPFLQQMRAKKL